MESRELHNSKLNNKGLSLVEVLCAVAIFTLVVATVSTIVVVSAKVYKGGVSETSVQQEAQLAANRIGEIIKNANSATIVSVDEAKAVKSVTATIGSALSIRTNDTKGYIVALDGKDLIYKEVKYDKDTVTSSEQGVLASNISGFQADVSDFEENRIVRISFNVENDGRNYATNYVMTARNEVVEAIDTKVSFISASCPTELYLEPGQTFNMEIQAVGNVNEVVLDGDAP